MKIAISNTFCGFYLSEMAIAELSLIGVQNPHEYNYNNKRSDPRLISVIEKLGKLASAHKIRFQIVEIPDDVHDWYIMNVNGIESIHEGRVWSALVDNRRIKRKLEKIFDSSTWFH